MKIFVKDLAYLLDRFHFLNYLLRIVLASCSLEIASLVIMRVSYEYKARLALMVGKSRMYMLKIIGPNMLLCGTLAHVFLVEDRNV